MKLKQLLLSSITILILSTIASAQEKRSPIVYSKLHEIEGTEYVYAASTQRDKFFAVDLVQILFINSKTGETNYVGMPDDTRITKIEQIKIDKLDLNLLLLASSVYGKESKMRITSEQ